MTNLIEIYSDDNIKTASYGILDRYIDVSIIINKLFANKEDKNILINSELFNYDPYFGKIKELIIIFESNKKIKVIDNTHIQYIYKPVIDNIIFTTKSDVINNTILYDRIKNIVTPRTSMSQLNYILSTNIRDEKNILEWIIYHLLIGFDRIVIIDHKSIIPVKTLIEPYHWKHKIDVIRNESEGPVKMTFLNNIIIPYMTRYCKKYFIHLDGDEYIYIKDNLMIDTFLTKYNCNILALHWLMFGSNNIEQNNNIYGNLITTFTKSDTSIHNHYKCFIKINKNIQFTFLNPHHILLKNTPTITTNVMNKHIQFNGNINKNFEELCPSIDLDELPGYLVHYMVQSKEDYIARKINRNRDDIAAARDNDLSILDHYNNIENNKLVYYSNTIDYVLENCKFNFGFIMVRYVNSIKTNEAWINCYNSIRQFYNNKIIIIDDNSDVNFITEISTINTNIIQSEFPRRGEFLPYYYYIKNKFFDRAMIIHDSMKFNKYYNFNNIINYTNFTRLFSFNNSNYKTDISYFKDMTTYLKSGNLLYQYHLNNINNMIGCFGICYIIDHKYILEVEKKYNISNLVNFIDSRPKRQTLERLLSCLFEMDRSINKFDTRTDILGCIFNNKNNIIEKKFFGR
jgi:hypothetical protein